MKVGPWHLVVWIDHEIAHLYAETRGGVEEIATILAGKLDSHAHHHSDSTGSGHAAPDTRFLAEVTRATQGAREILIVGPSNSRTALRNHMESHAQPMADRIVGVEPMPRSSEREIHKFARRYFRRHDLTTPRGASDGIN